MRQTIAQNIKMWVFPIFSGFSIGPYRPVDWLPVWVHVELSSCYWTWVSSFVIFIGWRPRNFLFFTLNRIFVSIVPNYLFHRTHVFLDVFWFVNTFKESSNFSGSCFFENYFALCADTTWQCFWACQSAVVFLACVLRLFVNCLYFGSHLLGRRGCAISKKDY